MLSLVPVVAGPLLVAVFVSAARRATAGERVRALRRGGGWRLPSRVRARLVRALTEADLSLEPEFAAEAWAGTVAGVVLVAAALSPGLAPLALVVGLAGGPATLIVMRGRARRRFTAALPGAVEQIAAHLRGGATLSQGVEALAGGSGPLAADLRRVRDRTELGVGLGDALARWPLERAVVEVRSAAGALALAATVGGASAGALDGLAASLRDQLGAAAEARSLSAQARLSAVVVGAAPLAYLVLSGLVDPGSVRVLVSGAAGRVCLGTGLALEGLAAVWMRRILHSVARP